MKKYLMTLSVLLVALVVVTGCGDSGKKLSCKGKEGDADTEAIVTFKDEKVSAITIKSSSEASYKEEANAAKTLLDTTYGPQFEKVEGVSYKAEVKDKRVTMILDIDISKTSDDIKESFATSSTTYDDIKKEYEGKGYTCK